jgi:hypothetical protein
MSMIKELHCFVIKSYKSAHQLILFSSNFLFQGNSNELLILRVELQPGAGRQLPPVGRQKVEVQLRGAAVFLIPTGVLKI